MLLFLVSYAFAQVFQEKGQQQVSCFGSFWENVVPERKTKTVLKISRLIILHIWGAITKTEECQKHRGALMTAGLKVLTVLTTTSHHVEKSSLSSAFPQM